MLPHDSLSDHTTGLDDELQSNRPTIGAVECVDALRGNELSILIRVIDQGPGVSKSDAKKLFQPFQQVNAAADKKQGGTGLGLALVRYLAREHKGIAWLEWSREGVGSCFSLLLPLHFADDLPEEDDDVHGTAGTQLFGREKREYSGGDTDRESQGDSSHPRAPTLAQQAKQVSRVFVVGHHQSRTTQRPKSESPGGHSNFHQDEDAKGDMRKLGGEVAGGMTSRFASGPRIGGGAGLVGSPEPRSDSVSQIAAT